MENLNLSQGRIMSEAVMLALARKGMNRQEAHSLIRKLALLSESKRQPFGETLMENEKIRSLLSTREVDDSLKPENYLGTARKQVDAMVKKTRGELGKKEKHGD